MPEQKVLLVTPNAALEEAASRAFSSAFIQLACVSSTAKALLQDKSRFCLVLLDMDSLGPAKLADLKSFLARMRGVPVIAMCNTAKLSSRENVEILSAGVDDLMSNSLDISIMVAKTRAHLRRGPGPQGPGTGSNDRAADNLNRG